MTHTDLVHKVLVFSSNSDTQEQLRQVFQGAGFGLDEQSRLDITDDTSSHGSLFDLIHTEEWGVAQEIVSEAKTTENPIGVVFIQIDQKNWERSYCLIERLWECDERLGCVLCLPSDSILWPTKISLSRPKQWAILRTPFLEEEAIQLVWCLSRDSSRYSESCVASGHGVLGQEVPKGQNKAVIDDGLENDNLDRELPPDEISASKASVENILQSMADSLLVINADLTIGAVNPSLLNLLGYSQEELIGQSPGLIFGEEFTQGAIMEPLLLQGSVSGVESSFLTRDGQLIPISVSGSMMQDEHGQFQGLVCVAQDITERKRMEEEKHQLHEQLLNASRQLGMAEVASGVLHNVGNVLNSIYVSIGVVTDLVRKSMVGDVGRISQLFDKHSEDLGSFISSHPKGKQIPAYLERLSEQLIEEKRLALLELERLCENAVHAQQCVAAQQDLAKPSGMTELVCLSDLVEEALTVNQDILENASIEISKEFQELPQVYVDKHQILQILVDVIRNACQAMESVEVKRLIIRIKLINGPPDSVCLEVQDSGIGIPPEDLTRIFGQGYSTKNGGRGMSLHSGSLMAKNMGGALRAQSNGIGHGAILFLDLPGNFHFPDL